jgi:hypothetical protein
MKEVIEIIAFGLLGLYFILFPFIMIMKIKYYKTLKRKQFRGISDLFSFFSSEWWIAGITWGFPILGRDKDFELNSIRKKANLRLYILYLTVVMHLTLFGILVKM